jgi:hypothetical protein
MDVNFFVELISAVGFPIAVVIVLGVFIWRIYKRSEQREDQLRQEIIENQNINKEAIKTLSLYAERLGVIETDIKDVKQDVMLLTERISH